jgi:hypothetical protein
MVRFYSSIRSALDRRGIYPSFSEVLIMLFTVLHHR